MKWIAEIQGSVPMDFMIEQETFTDRRRNREFFQYHIYIYINGVDTYDYLLDTLDLAKNVAFKEFQVPLDAWKQVE